MANTFFFPSPILTATNRSKLKLSTIFWKNLLLLCKYSFSPPLLSFTWINRKCELVESKSNTFPQPKNKRTHSHLILELTSRIAHHDPHINSPNHIRNSSLQLARAPLLPPSRKRRTVHQIKRLARNYHFIPPDPRTPHPHTEPNDPPPPKRPRTPKSLGINHTKFGSIKGEGKPPPKSKSEKFAPLGVADAANWRISDRGFEGIGEGCLDRIARFGRRHAACSQSVSKPREEN